MHSCCESPYQPQGQGFMAPTMMKMVGSWILPSSNLYAFYLVISTYTMSKCDHATRKSPNVTLTGVSDS